MDAILLDYATGALSEPARLLIDTHLAMRPERRLEAAVWETAGAAFFEADAEPIDQDALNAVLRRLDVKDADAAPPSKALDLPGPLGAVVGRSRAALPWRPASAGALEYAMPRWPQARLIRMTGPQSPAWTLGMELGLVLEGVVAVGGKAHERGDILLLDRETERPEPASGEAVYFSVQDSGYTARDVRDVMGEPSPLQRWSWRRA